ncbi:FitA-like ribbon-helix-helix domain-containing protein [Methylomagnum sp.]
MASMSIRGLDDQALAHLKHQAEQEGSSLNSLVLRLLRQGAALPNPAGERLCQYDDLDALAGTWSDADAEAFERHVAAFAETDPALWA